MHVQNVLLHNWERFKGEHHLALGPKPYAVVARGEDNPERSNFFGKSSLVRAVRFALYGEHEHRLEDGWITRGEGEGRVDLRFSDGTTISRSRKRGKATQFFCQRAKGDEAQTLLQKLVGLSREDFEATCYFAQGEMASHVKMKPEPRFAAVAGWVGLARLEAAEEYNRAELHGRLLECAKLADAVRSVEAALQECGDATEETVTELEARVAAQQERVREGEKLFRTAEQHRDRQRVEEELATVQRQLEEVPAEDADAESLLVRAKENSRVLNVAWAEADKEERQKRALARGAFDGTCPVAGIACPATSLINARVEENALLYQNAKAVLDGTALGVIVAREALKTAETRHQAEVRADERAKALEARETALKTQLGRLPARSPGAVLDAPGALEATRQTAQRELADLRVRLEVAALALRRRADLERRLQDAQGALRAHEATLAPLKEAAAILGRSGAQRVAAEGALSEIEAGANARLDRCGIDLSVRVSWDREGAGLARACGACGEPFPKSEKVKSCQRCGEARGPHVVQRLEYELSDRSGAADDMVGIAIRLAASEWLRRERGAAWSVAFLDEPMGQLDASHRKAVGQQLAAMLMEDFDQSFVIAHQASTLDALPGRIEIVGGRDSSTVRVVA